MKAARIASWLMFPLLLAGQQTDLLKELKFRLIGPFRGGRSVAVAGVPSQPNTYYFGGVGGGVWKTTDGGASWAPISDGFFKTSSVGAIAVADADPNVIYVGMGEACVRGPLRGAEATVVKARNETSPEEPREISRVQTHKG